MRVLKPPPEEPPDEPIEEIEVPPEAKDELEEMVRITHKLASTYGWSYKEIWDETPYPILKRLYVHILALEGDQEKFLNATEAAIYKSLKRMYPKKEE